MASLAETLKIPPHLIPSRNTTTVILVAAATVATPIAYLVAVRNSCLKRARICEGRPPAFPESLPDEVRDAPEDGSGDLVLSHERLVSIPVAVSSLRPDLQVEEEGLDVVLTPYTRATMGSWLETFGGRAVKKAITELPDSDELVNSFSEEHIQNTDFQEGNLVNGIYHVTHRGESVDGGERVEFTIVPPPALVKKRKDLSIHGIIVSGWEVQEPDPVKEEEGVNLVFFNETWMWRRQGESKPVLETGLGRWWHAGLVGWMIGKGIDAVTVPAGGASSSGSEKATTPAPPIVKVVPEKQPLTEDTETETETETETDTTVSEDGEE